MHKFKTWLIKKLINSMNGGAIGSEHWRFYYPSPGSLEGRFLRQIADAMTEYNDKQLFAEAYKVIPPPKKEKKVG